MGRRGPPPVPTEILRLRGSWRAGLRDGEMQLPLGEPEPPDWLSDEAAAEWARVAGPLASAGVLAQADRALLACYCEAWAEFVQARELLDRSGPLLRDGDGNPYPNPCLAIRDKACERLLRLAGHFGLSPSARARIKGAPPEQAPAVLPRKRG